MDNNNLPINLIPSDIESIPMGDVTADEVVSSEFDPSDLQNLETIDDLISNETEKSEVKNSTVGTSNDKTLDNIITETLEKAKTYFHQNGIEEQSLAEFMYTILTLNTPTDMSQKDLKMSPDTLKNLVDQLIQKNCTKNDTESVNDLIENLFGAKTAKCIMDKLRAEKIDEVLEGLLGENIKKMICDRLESENLDELFNNLIDEKLRLDCDPDAKHPNFDNFIEKILGKETQEFIKNKMKASINESGSSKNDLDLK